MSISVKYLSNVASPDELTEFLMRCDADFVPPLSGRVEILNYAQKVAINAIRFEAWSAGRLVGLVAAYCNDHHRQTAYITTVSVTRAWNGKGIAAKLMNQCVAYAKASQIQHISLEVASDNTPAIRLYKRCGFVAAKKNAQLISMELHLKSRDENELKA